MQPTVPPRAPTQGSRCSRKASNETLRCHWCRVQLASRPRPLLPFSHQHSVCPAERNQGDPLMQMQMLSRLPQRRNEPRAMKPPPAQGRAQVRAQVQVRVQMPAAGAFSQIPRVRARQMPSPCLPMTHSQSERMTFFCHICMFFGISHVRVTATT